MIRIPVNSSNVAEAGFLDGVLEVKFNNGFIYRYRDVPQHIYDNLLFADSVGEYFYKNISKTYEFKRIGV